MERLKKDILEALKSLNIDNIAIECIESICDIHMNEFRGEQSQKEIKKEAIDINKLSYSERVELYNSNRELYRKLIEEK